MNAKDPMSPDASPQRVPPGAGVRRVNDWPAYIVVALMAVFLVVMALVAMDRSAKQHPGPTAKDDKADNASRYAAAIVGDQKDGIVQPDKPASPPHRRPSPSRFWWPVRKTWICRRRRRAIPSHKPRYAPKKSAIAFAWPSCRCLKKG